MCVGEGEGGLCVVGRRGPSLGKINVKVPLQGSPYALKFV